MGGSSYGGGSQVGPLSDRCREITFSGVNSTGRRGWASPVLKGGTPQPPHQPPPLPGSDPPCPPAGNFSQRVAGICHDPWNSYAGVDVICPAGSSRSGSMLVLIPGTCSQLCDIHVPTFMGTTDQFRISPGIAFLRSIMSLILVIPLINRTNGMCRPVATQPGKCMDRFTLD